MSRGIDIRQMVTDAMEREGRVGFYLALTVHDWLKATGRSDGPVDGKCEVCHQPFEGSMTLYNWLDWHCRSCTEKAARADHEALVAAGGVYA